MSDTAGWTDALQTPARVERFASWVRNGILALLALFFAAQLAFALQHTDRYLHDVYRFARYYALPGLLALGFAAVAWRGGTALKARVAGYGAAVLAALIGFELLPTLALMANPPRSIVDAVVEMRADGERVAPAFTLGAANRWAGVERREAAMLANLPGIRTLLCGDDQQGWIGFEADAQGFNNPGGAPASEPLEVAVLGDSFVHGYCLPAAESIIGQLAARVPRSAGYGILGNGPLYELEMLKYYLPARRPRHVVWFFFEGNDLSDLENESRTAWLLDALDEPPLAHPAAEKERTLEVVRSHLDEHLESLRPTVHIQWPHVFGLLRSSEALGIHYGRAGGRLDLLERVLARARQEADAWGGALHLAYLPEMSRYAGLLPHAAPLDASKARVLAIAARLESPVIDLARAFGDQEDPLVLFDPRHFHYTREGARLVAAQIADALGYPAAPGAAGAASSEAPRQGTTSAGAPPARAPLRSST
jgi:hypothetical protein